MWWASAARDHPASSARGVLFRGMRSARETTRKPAPSPRFRPRRRASNGRHGSGSSAPSAWKPVNVSRQSPSVPPATTASTSPERSHDAATISALAPPEHALEIIRTRTNGPSASFRRSVVAQSGCDASPARSLWLRRGAAAGSAESAESDASISSFSNIPPVVPLTTSPTRAALTSSPADSIASRAATYAICAVRDHAASVGGDAERPTTSPPSRAR